MNVIEMRWVTSFDCMDNRRLQYRYIIPDVKDGKLSAAGMWSEWKDVPTVFEARTRQ